MQRSKILMLNEEFGDFIKNVATQLALRKREALSVPPCCSVKMETSTKTPHETFRRNKSWIVMTLLNY